MAEGLKPRQPLVLFLACMKWCLSAVSWGNVIILTVIAEYQAVSWARGMGSFRRWTRKLSTGLIIKNKTKEDWSLKKKSTEVFIYKITVKLPCFTDLIIVLIRSPDCVLRYIALLWIWLRNSVLQALLLSSDSNLVTVRLQGKMPLYLNLLVMEFNTLVIILPSFLVLCIFFCSLAYCLGYHFRDLV